MYRLSGFGDLPAAPANVQAIATAIATAEGGLTPGTFPYRTNNPCDIFVGGSTAGYSTMDAGWNACYNQINLILSGQSSIYTPDESIEDIAQSYAPASAGNNPSAWAANVASVLGISPNQPLTAVSGGSGAQASPDSTTGFLDSLTATLDLNTLSFTDDSGNLTGFGWLAIAGVVGLGVWVIAS